MPHRVDGGQCKLFEICQRPARWAENQELFCVLHLPVEAKNLQELSQAVADYRQAGRCDFRRMVFPPNFGAITLENQQFVQSADFRDAVFRGLSLAGSRFDHGLIIEGKTLRSVSLRQTTVLGRCAITAENIEGSLDLAQATFHGPVEIDTRSKLELPVWSATFHDVVSVRAAELRDLNWTAATFQRGLKVRGRVRELRNLHRTTFGGVLDLQECEVNNGLQLTDCVFMDDCALDLSKATMHGDLIIEGPPLLPREIVLNGTTITGKTRIRADLGTRRPQLVASDSRPRFGGETDLGNVELHRCRLVGNNLMKLECDNVGWPRRRMRSVLCDEVIYRAGNRDIPLGNLREAYQIIKRNTEGWVTT